MATTTKTPRKTGVPAYRLHAQSGQAVVTLSLDNGKRKDHLLGAYGSAESRAEYIRVLAEWDGGCVTKKGGDLSIAEMLLKFLKHADKHYRRPDGTHTSEVVNFKNAFRQLRALYSHTVAADFGPLALRSVREMMVNEKIEGTNERALSRKVINSRINRIRHVFKWAASLELIPAATYQALKNVAGLESGRSAARETSPVQPVPDADVDAILPHLRPQTRAIVELMRLTGMRPGEAIQLRRKDLDMSGGAVWLYRPVQHKNAWRGMNRIIAIGPKGQEVLKLFFKPNIDAALFSPIDAMTSLWNEQRRDRKTKVYPYQVKSRDKKLALLNEFYTVGQLDQAIKRACVKANISPWASNRLRHLHATNLRKQFGIEAAAASLGHHHLSTTEIYAEKNVELAKTIAAKVG